MLGKKQIGIKKRCKINYGFDFEETMDKFGKIAEDFVNGEGLQVLGW